MEPVGIFLGIYIDLKKEKKTKYHAKIDIFVIDSKQIKYLEHFKIKIIPCKRK
jgi:penicillin-binding protein-related factor A (putative recombinase)